MKTLPVSPRSAFVSGLVAASRRGFALSALCALLTQTSAFADTATDVNGMIRAGQFAEALGKVDAGLVQTPRDKQLRFLKGVILTELNKPNEAIAVFTKLTEDFPELPEPYNNLAVLFAGAGQYDKARAALEMAIKTNPTYATAHENLGDVYAKLASQAYDKALQLDSGNATAKSKLTMIRTLVGSGTSAGNTVTDAKTKPAVNTVAAAKPLPVPVPPPKQVAKVEPPKPEPVKAEPPKVDVARVEPKSEPKPRVEPKVEEKPVAKPVAADAEHDDVMNAVNAWARAWSAKDVGAYLAHYTPDYQPGSNQPHKVWVDDRRARIEGKGRISVQIESARVTVDGSTATVKFRQQYSSDRLHSNGPKTLVLTRQSGQWLIKQEHTGS